ncbi:Anthrax toxin receptor 2 [Hondaea fermentalgiana]|uniref:Anthrax toxin receptor 2 n=1 Tax=Hondaea fermentalgiana TaxID=2315210 RepID=A0A2R5GSJ7_9STRA|nr:Anthrax toxin receptor 2 [Hondaea fermentalgiana]|eukprot:GBG33820.1 Anthrax toxin receptor 2 [Hondaea fermentalgiana]
MRRTSLGRVVAAAAVAAMTLANVALQAQAAEVAAVSTAQDFYFVVDASGSMNDGNAECKEVSGGLTCMELLASFCAETVKAMAEFVGSYYESPENNGIRVAITVFRCMGQSKDPYIILSPTGNETEIAEAFDTLGAIEPDGNTCAETALTQTQEWIEEAVALAPPDRTSSILYVTDGFLERTNKEGDSDVKSRSEAIAADIRELNNTQIFALTLTGSLSEAKQDQQLEEVAEITDSTSRIFPVEDAGSLDKIVGNLTAYIIGDFQIRLSTSNVNGTICAGVSPMVQITGTSVTVLTNPVCTFNMSGQPDYVFPDVTATSIVGGFECEVPLSYYSSDTEDEVVSVQFVNVEAEQRREVGPLTTFSLDRPACVTASAKDGSDDLRCLGDKIKYALTGETVDSLLSNANRTFTVQCVFEFEDDGYSFTRTADATAAESGDSYTCELAADDASARFRSSSTVDEDALTVQGSSVDNAAVADVSVVSPAVVSGLSLQLSLGDGETIPGTTVSSLTYTKLTEPESNLDLVSPSCVDADVPTTVCWRMDGQAEATFSGSTIKWAHEAASADTELRVVCIIDFEDDEGNEYSYIRSPSASGTNSITCILPDDVYDPSQYNASSLERVMTTGAYLYAASGSGSGRAMALSTYNGTNLALDACIDVEVNEEPCFGADATVRLVPDASSSAVIDGSDASVKCFFIDDNNKNSPVEVEATQTALGDGSFECRTSDLVVEEGQCPLTFKVFELRSDGVTVLTQTLASETSQCLELSTRSSASEVFLGKDVSACWAQANAADVGAAVLFSGSTASGLDENAVQCRFSGGLPIAGDASSVLVSAQRDASDQGLFCIIPDELLLGEGNGVAQGLEVELLFACSSSESDETQQSVLGSIAFNLDVITGSPCLVSSVGTLEEPTGDPVCVGEAARVFVSGGTSFASLLASLDTSDSGSAVECTFDGGSTVEGSVVGSGSDAFVFCQLPRKATLENHRVSAVRFPRTDVEGGSVNVDVSGYELGAQGSCLSNEVVVDPQTDGTEERRRELQTSSTEEAAYCLGDALSTQFSGDSIESLLEVFGDTDTEERTNDANETETVTVLTQWECQWQIDTDWDPEGGIDVTQPIWPNASDSTIICESEVWSPFSTSSFNLGAYSSVTLMVVTDAVNGTNSSVGDPVSFEQDYKAQVCSGNLSQGSGVPATDADCARAAVELVLGGRSAITLAKEQDRVSCEFDGPSGLEVGTPIFTGGSNPSVECQAPGWEPKSDAGNYTSITLLARVDDGNETMSVKALEFAPTAARVCISVDTPSTICVGEPVTATLTGTSLGAYRAWNDDSFEGTTCSGSSGSSEVAFTNSSESNGSTDVVLCDMRSTLSSTSISESLTVSMRDVDLVASYALDVSAARNSARCLGSTSSFATCSVGTANTEIELSGASLELMDLSLFMCVLSNSTTSKVEEADLRTVGSDANGTVLCTADDAFDTFKVVLRSEADESLADGDIVQDNSTCTSGAATLPPSSEDDGESGSLGIILGVVLSLIIALLVLAIFVYARKRRQARAKEPVANDDLERGIPAKFMVDEGPAMGDGLLHDFSVGDRIEAQGDFDESGTPEAWHKGTLVADHHNGEFTVQLDHVPLDQSEQVVALSAMQRARSDFAVNDHVEAKYGAGQTWHEARVAKVNKNDTYDLTYVSGDLAPEAMVASGLVRAPLMNLEPGSLVEALHAGEGRYLRGVVDTRDVPTEMYGILFDGFAEDPAEGAVSPVMVPRVNVRPFEIAAGDLMDVKRPEDFAPVRAIVSSVDEASATCTLVDEETGESLVDVAFVHIYRPVFSAGQTVEVRNEQGDGWARARISQVNTSANSYEVEYLGEEGRTESGVPVARVREAREPANDPIPDIFRPPQRDHEELYDENGEPVPYHLRFKKSKPIAYHELPNNQFDVTVDMSDGLGLSLGWTNDSRVIVAGFRDLPISGSWGPIEATGLVGLKDELIKVNEIPVVGKSFVEVSELIKKSDKIIKLQFGRWDDDGPVSMGMQEQ